MIVRENSCHHLNQSNATLKLVPTWSLVFSRVLSRLPVFTLSSHWLTMMSTFALIGLLVYRHSIQNFSHSKTIHPFSQGIYPSVFHKRRIHSHCTAISRPQEGVVSVVLLLILSVSYEPPSSSI